MPGVPPAGPAPARQPCLAVLLGAVSPPGPGEVAGGEVPGRRAAGRRRRGGHGGARRRGRRRMKPILYVVRSFPGTFPARLRELFEVRGDAPRPPSREALLREAAGAAVLALTYLDRVDDGLLAPLPTVRHVASYGVGLNHIDLECCRRRGVLVTNTPGVVTNATADLAMGLLLAAARRVAEGDRLIRAGGWKEVDPSWMLGTEVTGKTLGIVGFGRIGQAVARRAQGFEMRILYANPRPVAFPGAERVALEDLLTRSDFVSLHVPLDPGTENLVARERLALMKRGAILVNTARGPEIGRASCRER